MDNNYFQTYDLGLASALVSGGFEVVEMDKSNPRKVAFCFKKTTKLEKSINDYWLGRLFVDARTLFESQKMLKNRIYSY